MPDVADVGDVEDVDGGFLGKQPVESTASASVNNRELPNQKFMYAASMILAGKPIIIDYNRLFSIYYKWHYIWKVPLSQRLPFLEIPRMASDISL